MGERRGDTREKIRSVALELFAEQGYEKTSLREIAERLQVTKAALYYHFRTKEDIVTSLFNDVQAEVEKIFEWAQRQPRTIETRREIIRRYAEMIGGPGGPLIRFMSENAPAVRELKAGDEARRRFLALAALLSDDDAPLPDQIRARLSIFTIQGSLFLTRDLDIGDEERNEAALKVALDLVESRFTEPRDSAAAPTP
jgi:AcrR family transcriptional regulator